MAKSTSGWIVQKISTYGSSNRNIARLVIQTDEIAKFATLEKADRETLRKTCHSIAHRLANAEAAAVDIEGKERDAFEALKDDHKRGGATEIPYVQNLELLFEGYFYSAKNILRDMGTLFGPLYGARFDEASDWCSFGERKDSKISEYLQRRSKKLPALSSVQNMIDGARPSLHHLVRVRNALEHPGRKAGTVNILNYVADDNGLFAPSYIFEGEQSRYNIISELKAVHETLLNLAEAVTVFGLLSKFPDSQFGIWAIPEKERNPAVPLAFRVIQIPEEMKQNSTPFTGKPEGSASN